MAANELSYTQIATILNDIMQYATGRQSIAPHNTYQFVSVAQTALKMGYDPLLNSISQVLQRTIFSIRPYTARLTTLQVDNQQYGAITRKLKISDREWEDDESIELEDGKSVDMFKVRKPRILQTNFYGQNVFQRHYTIFKHQLDTAFSSPAEFSKFITMVVTNCNDLIEQKREIVRRATLANMIGGTYVSRPDSCIHLITEYNAATGSSVTPADVFSADNFKPFILWAYARMQEVSALMEERTVMYQTNIDGYENMNQHTDKRYQRVYTLAPYNAMIKSMVMSEVFHETFINMQSGEQLAFWQSPKSPRELQVNPVYLQSDGTLAQGGNVVIDKLFGCIVDVEALGITSVNNWSSPTPFDAAGGYSNVFFHFTERYWNDFTEKCVLFLLD